MQPVSKPFGVLYTSTLAPSAPASAVPAILATARARNQQLGLTGLLVFDGQNFCQYLEGPPHAVLQCMDRISGDERHTAIDVARRGETDARLFDSFSMGYTEPESGDLIGAIRALRGDAALSRLVALVPQLDLQA